MKNIFQIKEDAHTKIKKRGQIFVRMAAQAIDSLTELPDSSESLPGFIHSYHGFHAEVFPFDNSQWVDNPNYKPGLTSEEYNKPENLAVDAGFHKIEVVTPMCRVCAVEIQDQYDECAGEPETWNLEMIPQDLFLSGTEPEIIEFFKERFKERVEREERNKFDSKWCNLFYNYTPQELIDCANAMMNVPADFNGAQRQEWLLNKMKESK